MKSIIKLEELGLFLFGIFAFSYLPFSWWWFPVLILTPDIGMLGYLLGNKAGAACYNLFHHRGLAILLYVSGLYFTNEYIQLAGLIMFAHIAMDRIFGYGLKYQKGFKYTHLGEIGSSNKVMTK